MIRFTEQNIININKLICDDSNESHSVNLNLLRSALSVYDSYYDEDELILCALLRSLVCNHCFQNGNKRTGFVVVLLSDVKIDINFNSLQDLIMDIVINHLSVKEIRKRMFN